MTQWRLILLPDVAIVYIYIYNRYIREKIRSYLIYKLGSSQPLLPRGVIFRKRERLRLMHSLGYTTSSFSTAVLVVRDKVVVRPCNQDQRNNRHCHVNGPTLHSRSLIGFFG